MKLRLLSGWEAMRMVKVNERSVFRSICFCGALLVASCSGGGGGGGGTPPAGQNPPPSNSAPVLSVPASISIVENSPGSILIPTATDSDGDALSFSISGGADRNDFRLSLVTGALLAITPLDFESPSDSNSDNVYEIVLRVSDGAASDTANVTITVTDAIGDGIVKIVGVSSGDQLGLDISGAPDFDDDRAGDLAIGTFKTTPTSPATDDVAYLLFSDAFSAEMAMTINLSTLSPIQGVRFFVGGLTTAVGSGFTKVIQSISTASQPLLLLTHPTAAGPTATTALIDDSFASILALAGSVDIGAAPLSPSVKSTLDGSLTGLLPDTFDTFNIDPSLMFSGGSEFTNVGDITGDNVDDFAFGTTPIAGGDITVFAVSGATLNADADGIINQTDLSFPDIFEIRFTSTDTSVFIGQSGDVDGDGTLDLVIAGTGPPIAGQGIVYTIYSAGLLADADGVVSIADIPGPLGVAILQDGAGPEHGLQLSANALGDITGDGKDDIFISIGVDARVTSVGADNRSTAFIVMGDHLSTLGSQKFSLTNLNGDSGVEIVAEQASSVTTLDADGFGADVARAGDADNDGLLDLAISAPFVGLMPPIILANFSEAIGVVYIIPSSRINAAKNSNSVIDLGEQF